MKLIVVLIAMLLRPDDEIRRVTIVKFNPLSIETVSDIHCYQFGGPFSPPVDTFIIMSHYINEFVEKNIAESHRTDLEDDIDTRAKVLITYHSGKVDELCLTDGSFYFLNGSPMKFPNDDFISWIRGFNK